ncbi:metallo-beta-lactamase superfamily protein [Verticillium dahliae VdLs.17]|uniref:Metallo-beta-lactamase superfamily protein n=1 Tax=Verticillium dahliae (strain VdLs.17 / ATCC MYA-4575 / FGSC 10137) TaxID=498257 RepID=G2WW51_VERDV|nr:metallo-beta-lactamase superfamily protein [Verticillium dahliae VdLs.17]EGY19821.1 metallo-beta-lactamase superfamily protein [Verticillium dahliae VdLs.17]KAH6706132.1 metallo-beta-lactamase superfamily protein [Verticillium dahliae]
MTAEPIVHDIYEAVTGTWQYVVADRQTLAAVLIDTVLDFDPASSTVTTGTADGILALVADKGYTIEKILETHIHADHLSAANYLQARLGSTQQAPPAVCIGKRIRQVQQHVVATYGVPEEELTHAFDHAFEDDEVFSVGTLSASILHLPGHTPDHIGYRIGPNDVFCGDSLFNADVGSARCDFPGGSATDLYASARKLLALPDECRIWTGHDYPPKAEGRHDPVPHQTVAEQKKDNKHLKHGVVEDEFVNWRAERDSGLAVPRLMHQALQVNARGGRLPRANGSQVGALHIPGINQRLVPENAGVDLRG